MQITNIISDGVLLAELGGRLAKLRLDRNLTQAQLAEQAGVSKRTIERLEKGAVATQLAGFLRVCRVLELLDRLEAFLPEPTPSPVEQWKLRGKQRQRAYTASKPVTSPARKWRWGDES